MDGEPSFPASRTAEGYPVEWRTVVELAQEMAAASVDAGVFVRGRLGFSSVTMVDRIGAKQLRREMREGTDYSKDGPQIYYSGKAQIKLLLHALDYIYKDARPDERARWETAIYRRLTA